MQNIVYLVPVFSRLHAIKIKAAYPNDQIIFISCKEINVSLDSIATVHLTDDYMSSEEAILLAQNFREWLETVDIKCDSQGLFSAYANLLFQSFILPIHQYALTFRALCDQYRSKGLSPQLLLVDYSWSLMGCSSTTFGGFGETAFKFKSFELLVVPYIKNLSTELHIPITYCGSSKNSFLNTISWLKYLTLPSMKIISILLVRFFRLSLDQAFSCFSRIIICNCRYRQFLLMRIRSARDAPHLVFSRSIMGTSEYLSFDHEDIEDSLIFQSLSTTDAVSLMVDRAKFKSIFTALIQRLNLVPLLIASQGFYKRVYLNHSFTKFSYKSLSLDLTQALREIAISINLDSRIYANSVTAAIQKIISLTGRVPKCISYSELKSPHSYILYNVAKKYGCKTRIYQQFKYFDLPLPYPFPCDEFIVSPYLLNHESLYSFHNNTSIIYPEINGNSQSSVKFTGVEHLVFVMPPLESENVCDKIIERISSLRLGTPPSITLCPHPRSSISKKMRKLSTVQIKPFAEMIDSCDTSCTLVISYNSAATKYIFARKIRFLLYLLSIQQWNELEDCFKNFPYLFYNSFDSLFADATPKWLFDNSYQCSISDSCDLFYRRFF